MKSDADRELAQAFEAVFADLAEDGATDAELRALAARITTALDELGADLNADAAARFIRGDRVPDWMPRKPCSASFDAADPFVLVEHFDVGGRLAVRRLRIGDPPGSASITFAD